MSISAIGPASGAYSYLQSLLSSSTGTRSTNPVGDLLKAFYPSSAAEPSPPPVEATNNTPDAAQTPAASAGAPPASTETPAAPAPSPTFSRDTMKALISVQEHHFHGHSSRGSRIDRLFARMDTDGDRKVSKEEFQDAFGENADLAKVDRLFEALDRNGDGAMSRRELKSAIRAAHRIAHEQGASASGRIIQALVVSGTEGATTDTTSNEDGSSTTTISYADGSKISLTLPPPGLSGAESAAGGTGETAKANFLQQLIQIQASFLQVTTSQSAPTSPEPTAT